MEEDIKILRKNLGDDLRIKSPRDGHPKDPINLIQIDFHGCDVKLASSILQRFKDSEKSLQQVPCVRFITGHARKRVTDAKIRPLVLSFLQEKAITTIRKQSSSGNLEDLFDVEAPLLSDMMGPRILHIHPAARDFP
ncbi:11667_t:CDS:2 [Diversispora eburnea]|uniref:11667_t:CDS:1 n=1 Tax=Diversispora eburnea TaxID=1213867 RepID=A0A9N9G9Z0_9GLOM|nr:11667_t:CDS:2 [Diversispora eburnea]